MRIHDPLPFMGIPSGIQVLTLTRAEKTVLERAVEILERAHDLVNERDPDHQDNDSLTDALCLAPPAIRELITEGITVS